MAKQALSRFHFVEHLKMIRSLFHQIVFHGLKTEFFPTIFNNQYPKGLVQFFRQMINGRQFSQILTPGRKRL